MWAHFCSCSDLDMMRMTMCPCNLRWFWWYWCGIVSVECYSEPESIEIFWGLSVNWIHCDIHNTPFSSAHTNWLYVLMGSNILCLIENDKNVLCNWSLARKIKERQLSVCFGQINIGLLTCSLSKLFSWMSPQWHHYNLTLRKSSSSHVTWIWATKNASFWRFVKEGSFDRMEYR